MSSTLRGKLLSLLPSNVRQRLRTHAFRAQHELHKIQFKNIPAPKDSWPVLLGISVPKSGTHLLTQILTGISEISPFAARVPFVLNSRDAETGKILPASHALTYLGSLRPLDIGAAHLVCYPETAKLVANNNFLSYFIYRDPRDVVISMCYFFGDMETNHYLYPYIHPLNTDNRIRAIICGPMQSDVHGNIGEYLALFSDWLQYPAILPVRFEDLIHDRQRTLLKISDHFLRRVNMPGISRDELANILGANIDPRLSPTFRLGETGQWREHFTVEHKKLFKDVAGDLLVKLDYEKNSDW